MVVEWRLGEPGQTAGRRLAVRTWRACLRLLRARLQDALTRIQALEGELVAERTQREALQAQCEALKGAVRVQAKQL
jgi:hypothetical protein